MSFTTISATTLGLADGDQSPTPVSGTVRITPRHPAGTTTSGGVIATGPVIVTITGGAFPSTDVPAREDSTARVEFHLYTTDGPVRMPDTEIPLAPGATVDLRDYLPAAVDPATGQGLARGERGPGITSITADSGVVTVEWEGGSDVTIPIPTAALATPTSDGLMPKADKAKLDGIDTAALARALVVTGERDVTALIPQITSGRATISRTGQTVMLTFDTVQLGTLTGIQSLTTATAIPNGFRPSIPYVYYTTVSRGASSPHRGIRFNRFGGCDVYSLTAGDLLTVTAVWSTHNDPPTTSPGTPA